MGTGVGSRISPLRRLRRWTIAGVAAPVIALVILGSSLPAEAAPVALFSAPYKGAHGFTGLVQNLSYNCVAGVQVLQKPYVSLRSGAVHLGVNSSIAGCPSTVTGDSVDSGRIGLTWLNFTVPTSRSAGYNASADWNLSLLVSLGAFRAPSYMGGLHANVVLSLHVDVRDATTGREMGTAHQLLLSKGISNGSYVATVSSLATLTVHGLALAAGTPYFLRTWIAYEVQSGSSGGTGAAGGSGAYAQLECGVPGVAARATLESATIA